MSTRLHKPDFLMLIMALLLAGIGLITIFAIGPIRANVLNNLTGSQIGENYFFIRQVIGLALAIVGFVVAFFLPFGFWKNLAKVILGIGLGLSLILAISGLLGLPIANCTNGACRWFNLGFMSFQPAEILKLGLILYLGTLLGKKDAEEGNSWQTLRPLLIVSGLSLFFVAVAQRDLGSSMTIVAIILACLLVSKVKTKFLVVACVGMAVFGFFAMLAMPYRRERLMTWIGLHSAEEQEVCDSACYHAEQALVAIGSGGLTGTGLGRAVSAAGYLPESLNDSVFAILGEVFGFFGLMILLALFLIFLQRLLRTASLLDDPVKRVMVVGFFGWILGHIVINTMSMMGLIPMTGVTLPFLSYGGTALLLIFIAFGIIYRTTKETARA